MKEKELKKLIKGINSIKKRDKELKKLKKDVKDLMKKYKGGKIEWECRKI